LLAEKKGVVSWVHQADKLTELAEKDPSPVVRLALASALQRLDVKMRYPFLKQLVAHSEDAKDPNLPLMYWYAAEPLAELDSAQALELAVRAKIPVLLPFMARRVAAIGTPAALRLLIQTLRENGRAKEQRTILDGVRKGLQGRRQVPMPD